MIYMRGQREDYDAWADAAGDDGWRWDAVLPLFKRSEDHYRGASEFHGAGGEWRVEAQRLRWDILEAFVRAVRAGRHSAHRRLQPRRQLRRRLLRGEPAARRALERGEGLPAADRGPPELHAADERAGRDGSSSSDGRCTGVEYRAGRRRARRASRREEVLLAAGAINSPQLLELSGIGRPDVLQACGIPVVHALPGVGENLQDHLQLRMVAKVRNVRTLNTLSRGIARQAADRRRIRAAPQRADEHGAVAAGRVRALRPGPGARERRVPRAAAVARRSSASRCTRSTRSPRACATCGRRRAAACTSRRAIPRAAPVIAPNYLATDEDRRVAVDSLRLTRRILGAPALAPLRARRAAARARRSQSDEDAGARGGRHRHDDLPSGRHLPDGRRDRSAGASSTPRCACAASRACASSTRR